jgi:cell filamentation protein
LPYGPKSRFLSGAFPHRIIAQSTGISSRMSTAGRYRTVRMTKDRSPFCFPENIAGEMRALFARLHGADLLRGRKAEAFVAEAAAFLAYLNAIHPFREGNGRTQLTFTALLAARAGHPFKLSRLDPGRFLQAMIASFVGAEAPLGRQLRNLVLD